MHPSRLLLVLTAICGVIRSAHAQFPSYTAIDLGELSDIGAIPYAINNHGLVVGDSGVPEGFGYAHHPFVWEQGEMRDLEVVPGDIRGRAYDINDLGQIVGISELGDKRAVIWDTNGDIVDLGWIGRPVASAESINELGEIAGFGYQDFDGTYHPYYWSDRDAAVQDLGTLGGQRGAASAINNLGQVAGNANLPNGYTHAFLWDDVNGMIDLGTFGGPDGYPGVGDINDLGQIAGSHSPPGGGPPFAILWDDGVVTTIGTLGVEAFSYGINNLGQVVGGSYPPGQSEHAFLWQDGDLLDLNDLIAHDLDWLLHRAYDISDRGQIVAHAQRGSDFHGFLLTEVEFELGSPRPGRAGRQNTLTITGAEPNDRVFVLYGTSEGYAPVVNCDWLPLSLEVPVLGGIVTVDANGLGELSRFVPGGARGLTVYIQAVSTSTCQISNVVEHTFN